MLQYKLALPTPAITHSRQGMTLEPSKSPGSSDDEPSSRPHPLLSQFIAPRGIGRPELLEKSVSGKVVLVTGASYGIGEALAIRLGSARAKVLLAARTTSRLELLARQINESGGTAQIISLDLSDPNQVAAAAAQINAIAGGAVDVVVHNAGKSIRRSLELSLDRFHDFQRLMAVNYLGPVQLQLALLPAMMARGAGKIVNVSSVGVRLPPAPRWSAYLASKSAFDIWIRSAAPELRQHGISCTSVYFGLVHTRMSSPTPAYRKMPGQTADEAATVICRAIIQSPRRIGPWWLDPLECVSTPLSQSVEWFFEKTFSSGSDTPAARGIDRG